MGFDQGCYIVQQINDPIMNKSSNVVHVDLNIFGSMSLHWISAKLYCTPIVASNDSQMMDNDTKIIKEMLQPNGLMVALTTPFYSTFVDDKTMVTCFLLDQKMGSNPRLST